MLARACLVELIFLPVMGEVGNASQRVARDMLTEGNCYFHAWICCMYSRPPIGTPPSRFCLSVFCFRSLLTTHISKFFVSTSSPFWKALTAPIPPSSLSRPPSYSLGNAGRSGYVK